MKRLLLILLFAAAAVSTAICAQQPAPSASASARAFESASNNPRVASLQLDSKLMGRKMPYRVVLPVSYAQPASSGRRFPVIYLLHGLTGHFDNWTDRTKLIDYSASYDWIVVTPEGENGWYTDSPTKPNDKYESYIVRELIPEIDRAYRTVADRRGRVVAGLSMGGFGGLKFGLKYPEMFALAGSFSGAVGASSYRTVEELPAGFRPVLVGAFGEPASETHKANDLFGMISSATAEKIKAMPYIYLSCGTEDFLFQNNRDFVELLVRQKVPHEYRQLPGGHDWRFWDAQVEEFLRLADRRVKP